MYPPSFFSIYPLSEQSLVIDFGSGTDLFTHQQVLAAYDHLRHQPIPGALEWVPAYSSLVLHYDLFSLLTNHPGEDPFVLLQFHLESLLRKGIPQEERISLLHQIPVCYDPSLAADLENLAAEKGLSVEKLIEEHTRPEYRVCFLGFLPGFAYMAEVEPILAMPRKAQPAERVPAGSVGIAGRQTGIYPLASPGGWHIIGRTPVTLFDSENEKTVLFQPGDRVRFYSIDKNEFERHQSRTA